MLYLFTSVSNDSRDAKLFYILPFYSLGLGDNELVIYNKVTLRTRICHADMSPNIWAKLPGQVSARLNIFGWQLER
jgi:hypothetical protein